MNLLWLFFPIGIMVVMLIHFICNGNTYRSRLAEAYLRSKKVSGIEVTSSGVEAERNINGPITWEADRIIKRNNLVPFMSKSWTQTTKELLDKSDRIIFFSQHALDYCQDTLGFNKHNYEIWNIKNIDELDNVKRINTDDEVKRIKDSENTYEQIKLKIDGLIEELLRK